MIVNVNVKLFVLSFLLVDEDQLLSSTFRFLAAGVLPGIAVSTIA